MKETSRITENTFFPENSPNLAKFFITKNKKAKNPLFCKKIPEGDILRAICWWE